MSDDMGYEALACNGNLEIETPNLDKLAEEGIRFTNCYSQPLSTPSRVKLMTGKYNYRNYEHFEYLNPKEKTFGNLLKNAGYATAIAGKWQLNGIESRQPGHDDVTRPYEFGFDEYCLCSWDFPWLKGQSIYNMLIFKNGGKMYDIEDIYGPDIFCEFVNDIIRKNNKKPFFVYYPEILPHSPFRPTPLSASWNDRDNIKNDTSCFRDMVEYMDVITGRIVGQLKESGVWDNTLLIFTADNGTHPSVTTRTSGGYITGAKGSSLNTGNHVPLIAVWPGKMKSGRVYNGIISFADFLPTLAEIAGIPASEYQTDGVSFLPVLKGSDEKIQSEIFIHYDCKDRPFPPDRWVMDGTYKLYRDGSFFNTENDPLEKKPLVQLKPEEEKIRERFRTVLERNEKESPFIDQKK